MNSDDTPATDRKLRHKKDLKAPERLYPGKNDPNNPRPKKVPVSVNSKKKATRKRDSNRYPTPESQDSTFDRSSFQPPSHRAEFLQDVLAMRVDPPLQNVRTARATPIDFAEAHGRQTGLPVIQQELRPFYRDLSDLVYKNDILVKIQTDSVYEALMLKPVLWQENNTPEHAKFVDFVKMGICVRSLEDFRNIIENMTSPSSPRVPEADCIMAIQNLLLLWATFNNSIEAAELNPKDHGLLWDECDMTQPAKYLDHHRWCMAHEVERMKNRKSQGKEMAKTVLKPATARPEPKGTKSQGKKPATDSEQFSTMWHDHLAYPVTSDEMARRHAKGAPLLQFNKNCDTIVSTVLQESIMGASKVKIGDAVKVMSIPDRKFYVKCRMERICQKLSLV